LVLASLLIAALYPHGTYCAAAGLIVIALYYDHAWRHLKHRSDSSLLSPAVVDPALDSFPERRYLYWGMTISVACFLLPGAADAPNAQPTASSAQRWASAERSSPAYSASAWFLCGTSGKKHFFRARML